MGSECGRYLFQAMFMSISYRYRGKVARKIIHTLEIATEATAALSENSSIPVNTLTPSDENSKILAYSAKKIRTKPTEEYSMLNPETSSDSPSEKSKGVRLVSANNITNHITLKNGRVVNTIYLVEICSFKLYVINKRI